MTNRVQIRDVWGRHTDLSKGPKGDKEVGWVRCLTVDGRYLLKYVTVTSIQVFVTKIRSVGTIDPTLWTFDGIDETPARYETTASAEYEDANRPFDLDR